MSERQKMPAQALQHAGDLLVFGVPATHLLGLSVAEIGRVVAPQLAFLERSQRHHHVAPELHFRAELSPRALREERTDRLRRAPDLTGNAAILLDFWKLQARLMDLHRPRVRPPEHVQRPHILPPLHHSSDLW